MASKTPWYPATIHPTRWGKYEVKTSHGITVAAFVEEWKVAKSVKVYSWRGLPFWLPKDLSPYLHTRS